MSDQHHDEAAKEARRKEVQAKRNTSRLTIIGRLHNEGRDDLAARLEKCQTEIRLRCVCCKKLRIVRNHCDNKWCPNCAPLLAHETATRMSAIAPEMHWPINVTFRAKSWEDRIGLREFRRAFAKLIKLRWFKRAVRGGVAGFEVSRMTDAERARRRLPRRKGLGYHPHAHALMDCRWFAVTVLRPPPGTRKDKWDERVLAALTEVAAQWSLCLGREGSIFVRATFIRDGGDPAASFREVVKYAVTSDVLEKSDEPIAPLIDDLVHTRNVTTFGFFYKHPALKKKKGAGRPCEDCGETDFKPASMVEAFDARAAEDDRQSDRARNKERCREMDARLRREADARKHGRK